MIHKIVTTTKELNSLKSDWERLEKLDPDVTFYSTFEVAKAWWDAYEDDPRKQLFIICIYDNSTVVGIAPLIIQEQKSKGIVSWRQLEYLGMGDFSGVLVDNTQINNMTIFGAMFKCIEENEDKWERMQLNSIVNNSALGYYLLKSRKYNRYFKCSHFFPECPRLRFSKYDNFDEYRKLFISKRVMQSARSLKKDTDYRLEIFKDYDAYEIVSGMHKKEQEYLKKYKGRLERKSLFNDERKSAFVKNLYKSSSNVMTFFIKDRAGNILGHQTAFIYKRVIHMWNTAYNPEFEKYGVGKILHLETMKYCFEKDIADELDFGSGRYPWKFEWVDDLVVVYSLGLWNQSTRAGRKMKMLDEIKNRIYCMIGRVPLD